MSTLTLAIGLMISVLGAFLAAVVALLPFKYAHRATNAILVVSSFAGVMVGIALAIGESATLALPEALYSGAAASAVHTWPMFYGMVFGLDKFSAIFYSLVSAITMLVAAFAVPYYERYKPGFDVRGLNALTALLVFGMQGVILSTNIVGFVTFWEIMSMSTFGLILLSGTTSAKKAGFLYLVLAHLGAGAIMAGLFLLSGGALLSDFSVLAMVTGQLPNITLYVALGLLLFGFGSKAGLVPFHVWLPEAYSEAPVTATALMSGAGITLALYGFLRVLLFMLPGIPMWFIVTTLIAGLLSAVIGVLYAVVERDIKRLLAYSSAENMGLIFAMVGVALLAGQEGSAELTQAALYAALFLTTAHALFKAGLFLSTGVISAVVGSRRLEDMGGLAKRMPQFSMAVCVLALTAASMPPFGSFIAEWAFLQSVVGALATATPTLMVTLVVVLAVTGFVTGLALFAMVKMYGIAFLAEPRTDKAAMAHEPEAALLTPIVIIALLGLLLGLFSPLVLGKIGAISLVSAETGSQTLKLSGVHLAPVTGFLVMVGVIVALHLLRQLFTDTKRERVYQTWNCGQPITPRMEYTATAFSAPIRFFFRFFLRTQKAVGTTPIILTNPWIASRTMNLQVRQVWYDRVYVPAGIGLTKLARFVSKLQNGSIQFYIGLILLTLFVTLIVAL